MKIILTSLLATILLSQSLFASTNLTSVTHKYQYALEVEWDQQDQNFLNRINKELSNDLEGLIESGMTQEELLAEAISSIKDESLRNELKANIELLSVNQMNAEDFKNLMLHTLDKNQAQGASWNPIGKVLIGTVAVLAITYLAFRIYMHEWGKRL